MNNKYCIAGYLRSMSYENEIGNCMYSSCTTSPMQIDGPYVTDCTSSSVRGVCALGEHVEDDNIGWNKSLKDCIEHHGTYFPEDFRHVCPFVGSPSWTNIFRQNHSFYYEIRSNNDSQHLVVNVSQYITSTITNQYTNNTNNSIPATHEKDVKNKGQIGSIVGGVIGGLIVLVGICIALLIYIKRPFSICGHIIAKNAPKGSNYSDRESLDKHVEVENQTTKSNYSNAETTNNHTHLKPRVHGHYNKLVNGSEVETGSSFQNVSGHKPDQQGQNETSSDDYTSFAETVVHDSNRGSEFDNKTYAEAQRRKQSAASLGSVCDSEFVGYLNETEGDENGETSLDAYTSFSKTTDSDIHSGSEFDTSFDEAQRRKQNAAGNISVRERFFSNNASNEVGLDNNDDIENPTTTKNEYSNSGNTINSTETHLLDFENVQKCQNNIKKLQSGWKDENDTGEKGCDHIPVDEDGKVSGEQDHYQTSSHVATALSRTLEGGSDFFYSLHNAQDRKKSNTSVDDSDFLGFSDS
ncbi:unnamed protein product [Mytilus coruscus]|uniref:Uncharacterized protein n=1 Tax=Mytilus coruscus TaxID=42192 RepID=A0A6J8EKW4_MYTCO|nr:unnamed protein product [Mytilus coruscus]